MAVARAEGYRQQTALPIVQVLRSSNRRRQMEEDGWRSCLIGHDDRVLWDFLRPWSLILVVKGSRAA